MTSIIITSIICLTFIIAAYLISRLIKQTLLSRTHLHIFRKKSEHIYAKQHAELNSINKKTDERVTQLEEDLKNLKNTLSMGRR